MGDKEADRKEFLNKMKIELKERENLLINELCTQYNIDNISARYIVQNDMTIYNSKEFKEAVKDAIDIVIDIEKAYNNVADSIEKVIPKLLQLSQDEYMIDTIKVLNSEVKYYRQEAKECRNGIKSYENIIKH